MHADFIRSQRDQEVSCKQVFSVLQAGSPPRNHQHPNIGPWVARARMRAAPVHVVEGHTNTVSWDQHIWGVQAVTTVDDYAKLVGVGLRYNLVCSL